MLNKVYSELKSTLEKKALFRNFDLTNYNTYKVKCVAKIVVVVNSIETFVKTMIVCDKNDTTPVIIGHGSNIIFGTKILHKVVIIFSDKFECLYNVGDHIIVSAGASLSSVIGYAKKLGLSGLEHLSGIPASVGGAIYMNASAFGHSISDVLTSVVVYSDGKIMEKNISELEFGYRNSCFQTNKDIILRAEFKLKKLSKGSIQQNILECIAKRNSKQEIQYPNAGSVFKNGNNYFAGELIDKCELKNYNIGNAYISNKHANFIINKGNATGEDIIKLINHITYKVYEKFGIELELEQKIIGDD